MHVLLALALMAPAPARRYPGALESRLVPQARYSMFRAEPASPADLEALPAPLAAGESAFVSKLSVLKRVPGGIRFVLVERAAGEPFFYLDRDLDGRLDPSERLELSPLSPPEGYLESAADTDLPGPADDGPRFPLRIAMPPSSDYRERPDRRALFYSYLAAAVGFVEIDGRRTRVELPFDFKAGGIDLRRGDMGVDTDGDGSLDLRWFSPETARADDEALVFRAGKRYVSVETADWPARRLVLVEHPASHYRRLEVQVGRPVEDFTFRDLAGRSRRLSDLRGKHVLLDVWGTWCPPCVSEIPHLKAAYQRFRGRGFEILGIDSEPSEAKEGAGKPTAAAEEDRLRRFLTDKGVTWTNTAPDSGRELAQQRLRVAAFPTHILLDPRGTVLSIGGKDQLPLHGERLMESLARLLEDGRR
jgi:peroxiredoxin